MWTCCHLCRFHKTQTMSAGRPLSVDFIDFAHSRAFVELYVSDFWIVVVSPKAISIVMELFRQRENNEIRRKTTNLRNPERICDAMVLPLVTLLWSIAIRQIALILRLTRLYTTQLNPAVHVPIVIGPIPPVWWKEQLSLLAAPCREYSRSSRRQNAHISYVLTTFGCVCALAACKTGKIKS